MLKTVSKLYVNGGVPKALFICICPSNSTKQVTFTVLILPGPHVGQACAQTRESLYDPSPVPGSKQPFPGLQSQDA